MQNQKDDAHCHQPIRYLFVILLQYNNIANNSINIINITVLWLLNSY